MANDVIPIQTWQVIDETEFSEFVEKHYERPYKLGRQEPGMEQDTVICVEVNLDPGNAPGSNPYRKEIEDQFQAWLAADPNKPVAAEENRPGPPEPEEWLQPGGLKHRMYWEEEFYPNLEEVLDDLGRKGILPEGEYRIHSWW